MSWSRRWTGCADGGSAAPGAWSAPSLPCGEGLSLSLLVQSNQRNTPPSASRRRAPVLLGPPRDGAELAALRHPRLFALAGPVCSARYKADPDIRSVGPYPPVTSRYCGTYQPRGAQPVGCKPSPLEQHQADRQRAHARHQPINGLVALRIALIPAAVHPVPGTPSRRQSARTPSRRWRAKATRTATSSRAPRPPARPDPTAGWR